MNRSLVKKQTGQVMVLMVLMIVMLLGFAAIAIDVTRIVMIRNELQNAADAAALSGANYLYPLISSGPNWSLAQTKALAIAKLNYADNVLLTDATVQSGFWNIKGTPSTLQATTITPGQYDLTAIKVTVTKAAGKNGGPVQLLFGPIIGLNTFDISASAIAMVGGPATMKSGKIFPIAMSKTLYDSYWSSTTNAPKIDPATGQPYVFRVAGDSTVGGAWTSFNANSNAASTISNFMATGSPIPYVLGDSIWISTGAKAGLYDSVPSNVDVLIPVVVDVTSSGSKPIVAFGVIHIDFAVGGSGKYIQVRFSKNYKSNESPGSYSYGIYTSSRLAH